MGLRDKWGQGGGTWADVGGLSGPAWWNETPRATLGGTGLGHVGGLTGQAGTLGWGGLGDKSGHGAGTWGGFGGPV